MSNTQSASGSQASAGHPAYGGWSSSVKTEESDSSSNVVNSSDGHPAYGGWNNADSADSNLSKVLVELF